MGKELNGLIDAIAKQLEQIKKEHDFHEAQEKIHAQLRAVRESQALHLQETISLFNTRMQSSIYSDLHAGSTDASNFSAAMANTEVLHPEEEANVAQNSFEPDDLESKNSEIDYILKDIFLSYPDRKISPDSNGNDEDNWSSST